MHTFSSLSLSFSLSFLPDLQCCSVEPLPEQSLVSKFEGKQVKDEITRLEKNPAAI